MYAVMWSVASTTSKVGWAMLLVATLALPSCQARPTSADATPAGSGVEDANLGQAVQTQVLADRGHALTTGTQAVAGRASLLAEEVTSLLATFDETARTFDAAAKRFEDARQVAEQASGALAQAKADFETAERNYRWIAYVLIISSAIEAGKSLCADAQSTSEYRATLCQDKGVCLGLDQQVDHVFPHAAGGANVPENYQVLSAAKNLALGASLWEKFLSYPIPFLQGMAASAIMRFTCGKAAAWSR